MSSRSLLTQSETADISVNLEMAELAHYDSGYNSSDSPIFSEEDNLTAMNESLLFHNKGYRKLSKISDTLQGALYKALNLNHKDTDSDHYVAIKRTSKYLHSQRIAIEDDTNYFVSENIVKEASILKYITVDNTPIGAYIVKYIDFFESDTDYYLIQEYIPSETNLKQFIAKAQALIHNGKLSQSQYNKMMKYILWQLFVTIEWMHQCMHCCHLDLCLSNIMLQNANFIETKNGICINNNICIKLVDFGVSQCFQIRNELKQIDPKSFLCEKHGYLSIDNEGYFSREIFYDKRFNAVCADNWNLGMIMYECMCFEKLYSPLTMHESHSGYYALCHNRLKEYLAKNDLLRCFSNASLCLLRGLLNMKESKRYGMNVLMHSWFAIYFKRYKNRIMKKFNEKMKLNQIDFPFYR